MPVDVVHGVQKAVAYLVQYMTPISLSLPHLLIIPPSPQLTTNPAGFPDRQCPNDLRAQVRFPSCWDGEHAWLPGGAHMAYGAGAHDGGGKCPDSHPYRTMSREFSSASNPLTLFSHSHSLAPLFPSPRTSHPSDTPSILRIPLQRRLSIRSRSPRLGYGRYHGLLVPWRFRKWLARGLVY